MDDHGMQVDAAVVATLRRAGCVFAEDEAALLVAEATSDGQLTEWVARRVDGEPLECILGWTAFCGMRIAVTAGVFVPRRRTEFLVERAVALVGPGAAVVDLCCGSGAVAAGIARQVESLVLFAVDLDPTAIACAERNLAGIGTALLGDLDDPLPRDLLGRVDVIVANAPYVPTGAIASMPPEARDHEARIALDGGSDGVDVHRRVAALAPRWLIPGGYLLVETSDRQADLTVQACVAAGLTAVVGRSDDIGATVVIARARLQS
ncbi:putative protein N(5)-glutamine methyltransferase [Nakamurella flavida]|uniref:peptide chain release factor N(5)-glutamine methyltransferase n=1 Tax=Nakamurella flavida TaxID=363630 RepID=A0A938YMJ3_9ACTN|nr:putative protein N(5)-glutamine methyltransferase [Nakamurella flavida]MBM9475808.1 putative protein N(5)-glutamine methyltransferase [Nakamurella flavida]MDP9777910.1 release factor glutamine methyltransferase [Nakamurella flavida]